ncbi:MAG: radical SAM protein [Halopenitus sp.]
MATYLDNEGYDVDFVDFSQTTLDDDHHFTVDVPRAIKGSAKQFNHYGWSEDEIAEWFDENGDDYTHFVVDALTPYFKDGVEFVYEQIQDLGKPMVYFGEWPQLRPNDFQETPAITDNWEVGVEEWLSHQNNEKKRHSVRLGGVSSFSLEENPMDELPAPDWDKFTDPEDYPEPHCADVRFSRGCVERCDFCHVAGMYDGRFNFKSTEKIIEDLEDLIERQGYEKIKIRDDNFCAATKTAKEVFNAIADRWPDVEIMQPEGIEMRTASRDRELIEAMGRCNYHSVRVGFETATEGKFSKNNLEWWETAYDYFTDAGFGANDIYTFVIRGHPKMERSDEIHTAIYLSQFDVTMVSGGYRLVPGTELWEDHVDEHGEEPPYEYGFGLPIDDDMVDDVGRLYRTVTHCNEWGLNLFHDTDLLQSFEELSWVDEVDDRGDRIAVKGTVSGWRRTEGIRYGFALELAKRGYYRHKMDVETKEEMVISGHKGSDKFTELVMECAEERGIETDDPPGGLL